MFRFFLSGWIVNLFSGSFIVLARLRTPVLALVACAAILCSQNAGLIAADFGRMQAALVARFGSGAETSFAEWRKLLAATQQVAADAAVGRINDFFNRRIRYQDDHQVWGEEDYWATPMETLGRGAGDCEDFAIAKYYSLVLSGVPIDKLRLVYVKATLPGQGGAVAHMVLAYYPLPDADPLILDNLNPSILPARSRPDLVPVFTFNSQGVYVPGSGAAASTTRYSRWQALLEKARREGFD